MNKTRTIGKINRCYLTGMITNRCRIRANRQLVFILILIGFIGLFVSGCDYWPPPLEEKLIENGGTYLIWWVPDASPAYKVFISYQFDDSIFVTNKAETLVLRQLTLGVDLSSLNKNGHNRGYHSYWNPHYTTWPLSITSMLPINFSDSTYPFGYGFDSLGTAIPITWNNLYQLQAPLVFWIDSTGLELVGMADTNSPGNSTFRSYLAIADSFYPESLRIAPPGDTFNYHTRVPLQDTTNYWLWIDTDPVAYDSNDHFALLKVNRPVGSQYIEIWCGYQNKSGLRWFP